MLVVSFQRIIGDYHINHSNFFELSFQNLLAKVFFSNSKRVIGLKRLRELLKSQLFRKRVCA